MQQIIEQHKKTGDVHHFHLLEGSRAEIQESLKNFLCDEFDVDPNDKSLYFDYDFDQFQVGDSRALTMKAQIKTPEGKKMIFLVFAKSINQQAQNALLKMLEEPSARTYFFVVLPRLSGLLPTLLSRAVVIPRDSSVERINTLNTDIPTLKELQQKTVGERLKFVDGLVKEIKDEKRNRIDARQLVQNLITEFQKELQEKPTVEKTKKIQSLMQIEDYLGDSGASIKILLERAVLLI
jgi:DNA polymerase III gamma/tau subunit